MEISNVFKMSKDEIKGDIDKFIITNTNEEGLDLSKLYLAHLVRYSSSVFGNNTYQHNLGINCPVNFENNPNKMTIVYILKSQSSSDHIFIDVFNETLLQSTYVNIPGVFMFAPEIRSGVTVNQYGSLNSILGINRLSFDDLKLMFNIIIKMSEEEIMKLSDNEFSKILLSQIGQKNHRL